VELAASRSCATPDAPAGRLGSAGQGYVGAVGPDGARRMGWGWEGRAVTAVVDWCGIQIEHCTEVDNKLRLTIQLEE
jgi:hypothetical protein